MSKAEDRYLEHFLDGRLRKCSRKEAFLYGYHQSEKDIFEWLKKHAYKYFLPGRKYVGAEEMVKDIEQIFSES